MIPLVEKQREVVVAAGGAADWLGKIIYHMSAWDSPTASPEPKEDITENGPNEFSSIETRLIVRRPAFEPLENLFELLVDLSAPSIRALLDPWLPELSRDLKVWIDRVVMKALVTRIEKKKQMKQAADDKSQVPP